MKIYVAHSQLLDFKKDLYEPILNSDLSKEHEFIFPHESSSKPYGSEECIKNDIDFMLAEVSEPSTGLGIELAWADTYGIPILCIYKKEAKISGSIESSIKCILAEYSNKKDLILSIERMIKEVENGEINE